MSRPKAYNFDQFFLSGLEPNVSPFLSEKSQKWGKSLSLKNAVFALVLLALAQATSKINTSFSFFSLTVIYFLLGTPAILKASLDVTKINVNINVLMTLAAFFSIIIGSPYEGAFLLVLFALANALTERVAYKTKSAIHELNKINPTKVLFLNQDGSTIEKAIREVQIGDMLLIKAGEIVPLDGTVISGASSLNLKHLTGEAAPLLVKIGDAVPSGAENQEGVLTIKVLKSFGLSTLNTIIQLMEKAEKQKPKVEAFFDAFSKIYAIAIIFLTAIFAAAIPLFFNLPYLGPEGSLYRSLAFLIAASPCALILAVPASYLSSISAAAKKGIILKGGLVLDALFKVRQIAFDKTGTLTTGDLKLTSLEKISGPLSEEEALKLAAGLEQGAKHPIAKAILNKALEQKLALPSFKNLKVIPGYGVEGEANGLGSIFLGHPSYFKKDQLLEKGSVFLFVQDSIFVFHFEDQERKNLRGTIHELKKNGLKTIMLTGDTLQKARAIADSLSLDEYYAGLKPEEKLHLIEKFSQSEAIAMVGDGINDAPALAKASVGISMGQIGSATAVNASDVILIKDDLQLLPWLFQKTKKTRRIVKENITLALAVILFASVPALLGLIPLWLAVILHEGGTLTVGLNSLRLLKHKNK